jgi:hypothetical protein
MFAALKAFFQNMTGAGAGAGGEAQLAVVEYEGYRIRPAPYRNEGRYQTAGIIEKDGAEGTRTQRFIRAETHGTMDEAAEFAIAKGKQIIDERGDRLFDGRP